MNKSNIKIIFVDIDQTILFHHNNRHTFDKKSLRALKKAQKNGVKVFISTARPYDSARRVGLFDKLIPNGIVCSNGGVAIYNEKVIYCDHFSEDVVKQVVEACESLNLVAEISTEKERYFTNESNEIVEEYFKFFQENYAEIRKDFTGKNVTAMLLFSTEDFDKKFFSKIDKKIYGTRFHKCGLDVKTHEIKKKDGMSKVLKKMKIKKRDSMSIGDSRFDASMFEVTGENVAMGNGDIELKNQATFVTKDIRHHGVYFALKYYKII